MMFLRDCCDLFIGVRSSHMGAHQYVPHAGIRNGKSTSGDLLWAEAEAARAHSSDTIFSSEAALLREVANEIGACVPSGLPIIDLGPGTVNAFKNKTLPILQSLQSGTYIPVDESVAFLQGISNMNRGLPNLKIKPVGDDFFEGNCIYCDEDALVCSFGSTISNIESPISKELPKKALTDGLSNLAAATNEGWLLVAFDSNQKGDEVKAYYNCHALFQMNVFDRMAVELPLEGFDPLVFEYEPEWIASSGQLAHIANVKEAIDFKLAGRKISLKKGQKLHLKNSYKFTNKFFEQCCDHAGLEILRHWSDFFSTQVYLLRIMSKEKYYVCQKDAAALNLNRLCA